MVQPEVQQREDRTPAIHQYTREREALLSFHAARSDQARRRKNRKPEDIRTPYSRDADRIIHTRAYTRYIDKTQVFYLVENDHITHRVIHVQLVSKIARTIGRCLRLNEDLIEAIALGHDIGHIPYGHFGEACLSDLCEEHGVGKFFHNVQSVRSLDRIEDQDLTMQVLDGILCHNGEADDLRISPVPCADWASFDCKVRANERGNRAGPPMTLEGCVVKFADTIAYIGRDLQDAQEVGLIRDPYEIPKACQEIFGVDNRAIIDTLIHDLLENSDIEDEGYISYSREVEYALSLLRAFSRNRIYNNPVLTAEREKIRLMYRTLFSTYLSDIEAGRHHSKIFTDFIHASWVNSEYLHAAEPAELVRDFVAGMTDRYFLKRFEECVLPHRIEGTFR
ncbi:deoxyguanosinetriphosphate triphosphohydrolase family protein [Methanoregula sp.]|uniref:deoxyguanosinetriphosphate triphosphohydrolase family protein n=1 Tax=Methanoregula sp. TaxID=2052170 RepID=UPI002CBD433B|nr:HD domain-containing protein [Methanoregula sp.]HVP97151.1 HD domain-containing protein [Methanoregula sp.]